MTKQEIRDFEDYCEKLGVSPCDLCEKTRVRETSNCGLCKMNTSYHNFFEENKIYCKVRNEAAPVKVGGKK